MIQNSSGKFYLNVVVLVAEERKVRVSRGQKLSGGQASEEQVPVLPLPEGMTSMQTESYI